MGETTELEGRLAAARPADDGEQRLAAIVASRLFGASQAPPATVGRFTLLERIGRGGMGEVYAAHDPVLDRKIALKLLRADGFGDRDGLVREARAAARLAHPNVVSIHDVGALDDGGAYVAMELIAGVTLRVWLRERPPLAAILRVFVDAGRGLAAAHRAGVIHRDFKPENVLIGDDGRARVVDFGLARVGEPVPAEDARAPTGRSTAMGTPAYMSPEQLRGQSVDARSDQFSFCVALREAIAGRHPFGADEPTTTAARLHARIVAGEVAPGDGGAPTWLRRLLQRGLSVDPAARHPSMDALVDALEATPLRRRRRGLLLAGVALVVASSALTAASRDGLLASRCDDVEAELAGVWDARVRAATQAGFAASGLPDAEEVWLRLAPRLDEVAGEWVAARRRACERLEAAPSDELRLRDACLQRRRGELRGLTTLLQAADRAAVLGSIGAVDQLTPLTVCDDVEDLRRELSLAEPGRDLAGVEALRRDILDAATAVRAGEVEASAPRVAALTAAARSRGGPTVLAEALLLGGLLKEARGQYDAAARDVEAAVHEAIAARHRRLHAEAAIRMVWLNGSRRRRPDLAASWAAHAEAALRAIGGDARLRARLLAHEGTSADIEQDHARAERLLRAALELQGASTHAPLERALTVSNLGLALLSQDRRDEAEPLIAAALASYRDALGPGHPIVAGVLSNLGHAHLSAGRLERAVELLREALAIKERALGRDHPELLSTLTTLGSAYSELGRSDEARASYLRGIAIAERTFGPDAQQLDALLHNLAFEAWVAGAHEEVLRHAGRALEIETRHHGAAHPILAPTLELLARSALELGRNDEAAATIRRALALSRPSVIGRHAHGAVLLSAAWIGRATGVTPAEVRRLADEAATFLGDRAEPDQRRELAALRPE